MTSGSRGEAGHSLRLSVSAEAWERNSVCVCICVHTHLHWTEEERLIVCDMGQEGMEEAAGLMETLSREESSTQSQRVSICMCVLFV